MEFSIVTFLLTIAVMAFVDVRWALDFADVEEMKVHAGAFWSAMIIIITAFTITTYVESAIYIIAAFIGAYLGTIIWKKKEAKQNL